jgi:hypothetical protein
MVPNEVDYLQDYSMYLRAARFYPCHVQSEVCDIIPTQSKLAQQ